MSPTQDRMDSDDQILAKMGYQPELARVLGGFSNFAISLSIICILAGGITSFHVGYCSVGGASIGLGWPLVALFALIVAATMGQIASAFPTAGGLYHWAAILGGRGWGWITAWFNLAGLIAVLAAINVGAFRFAYSAFFPDAHPSGWFQLGAVALITSSQAFINHLGIRVTKVLTDFSGYWILGVSAALTVCLFLAAPSLELDRLVTFSNYSGTPHTPENTTEEIDPVWPVQSSLPWLFALSFLLPGYTLTGFDASAHVAEETAEPGRNVPRGIVRSVWVSATFGWFLLVAVVLAIRHPDLAAEQGENLFVFTLKDVLPEGLASALILGILISQYLCGLATVTSASRMVFAFARDGGLPLSPTLRTVSTRFRSPTFAIWVVAGAAILFTAYADAYATIASAAAVLLYISYVLPTTAGLVAYGHSWTKMGPWTVGRWFRLLSVLSILGCGGLIVIGVQPPNEKAAYVVVGLTAVLVAGWYGIARKHFPGPPISMTTEAHNG